MMRYDELIERLDKDRPITGAEIGVWEGDTSYNLLKSVENIFLHYMIDPYLPYDDLRNNGERTNFGKSTIDIKSLEAAKNKAEEITEQFADRRIILCLSSTEAAEKIKDGTLDYVFIDAEHNYESAMNDIKTWLPKVKSGGIISGHNYGDNTYNGVTRAVNECFPVVETGDDWTWFVRIKK